MNSLKHIQSEIEFGLKEGISRIGNAEVDSIATNKYMFSNFSFLILMNVATKYIAEHDIEFTEKEVKDFLERHPTREVNGVTFASANESTNTLKDHLLLPIYQFALIHKETDPNTFRDKVQLKYLQVCKPAICENIPGLKYIIENMISNNHKKVEEVGAGI